MLTSVKSIDMEDMTEAMPAIAAIAMMIFTYNIANGLTSGLVLYVLIKLLTGKARQLNGGSYVLAGLCLVYFVFGMPH
jgi:adenine/guanine/hypoxanthine permease